MPDAKVHLVTSGLGGERLPRSSSSATTTTPSDDRTARRSSRGSDGLPRRDARRVEPHRHPAHAPGVRPAAARDPPHARSALLPPRDATARSREEFVARMADDLEQLILRGGPGDDRRLPRRAGDGRRRRDRPAGRLLRRDPRGARALRHPVLRRTRSSPASAGRATGSAPRRSASTPQTMTLGKGLSSAYQPIAALVVSGDIYDGMEKRERPGRHVRARRDVLGTPGRRRRRAALRRADGGARRWSTTSAR